MIEILILLIFHYIADYLSQTREESITKSVNKKLMLLHCLKYSIIMLVPFLYFDSNNVLLLFSGLFLGHLLIDDIFCNIMSKMELYRKKETTQFLNLFGLNQLLNQIWVLILFKLL